MISSRLSLLFSLFVAVRLVPFSYGLLPVSLLLPLFTSTCLSVDIVWHHSNICRWLSEIIILLKTSAMNYSCPTSLKLCWNHISSSGTKSESVRASFNLIPPPPTFFFFFCFGILTLHLSWDRPCSLWTYIAHTHRWLWKQPPLCTCIIMRSEGQVRGKLPVQVLKHWGI